MMTVHHDNDSGDDNLDEDDENDDDYLDADDYGDDLVGARQMQGLLHWEGAA